YSLLEREIIPTFYARDATGIPRRWVFRMRESMARLTERFSATRVVSEYLDRYYASAAVAYRERAANDGALGKQVAAWHQALDQHWPAVRVGPTRIETDGAQNSYTVDVFLGSLDPDAVRLELYAEGNDGSESLRQEMIRTSQIPGEDGAFRYQVAVDASRSPTGCTARALPWFPGVSVPLEENRIAWER